MAITTPYYPDYPSTLGRQDEQTAVLTTIAANTGGALTNYALRLDDTTTSNVTYVGTAAIGALPGAAVWSIKKLDQTTGLIITWAGAGAFTQIWDNRAALVYG